MPGFQNDYNVLEKCDFSFPKTVKKMAPIQHSDLICVINQMWKLVFNPNEKTPLFLDILCSRIRLTVCFLQSCVRGSTLSVNFLQSPYFHVKVNNSIKII